MDQRFAGTFAPGNDPFELETHAVVLEALLAKWFAPARAGANAAPFADVPFASQLEISPLDAARLNPLRREAPLTTCTAAFAPAELKDAAAARAKITHYCASLGTLESAELRISGIEKIANEPLQLRTAVSYSFVGRSDTGSGEQRTGAWELDWRQGPEAQWKVTRWIAREERRSLLSGPGFVDVTARSFRDAPSVAAQLARGVDDWRTALDGAFGVDIYGNHGISVGDFDNDGFDDIYVCQPAGLPNRLYRNRGNGTFEDVSAKAGIDVLDATSCALFVDLRNSGHQDLIVVRTNGPLLFLNNGDGTFSLKPDAFRFVNPPQGALTAAAAADYDGDGFVDIYFCLYSYYQGLSEYQYPTPYYDAQNGPPNFLFHNRGDWTFEDVTEASGLNAANTRYTLACAWNDFDNDGFPDLYVVNDFGRKVLYRNLGNGKFEDVSRQVNVEDAGEGMSSTWFDYDNDGREDLYVVNMWEAAGKRVTAQTAFMPGVAESIRKVYQQDAEGNTLLRNQGPKRSFSDVTEGSGTRVGGWNWSSAAWDVDGDGFSDLYVANGFISGPIREDLSSFYWRRIVAQSYAMGGRSKAYEDAWQRVNEAIRSDYTWSGYQRNNLYVNNRDGSFTEAGALLGLGCLEDGRAFALADLDNDGRLEVVLKNRNAPQLRILHNQMQTAGRAIAFTLRGVHTNRDAIGAVVELRTAAGTHRQTVSAGSGFLSQHSKTLLFTLPAKTEMVRATIHWPRGETQQLDNLPSDHRIHITQGRSDVTKTPFAARRTAVEEPVEDAPDDLSAPVQTWLVDPIALPRLGLTSADGSAATLPMDGMPTAVVFYAESCAGSDELLLSFSAHRARMREHDLAIAAVSLGNAPPAHTAGIPVLTADTKAGGILGIFYRYLFQRHREMPLPTIMLMNAKGEILKVYSGGARPEEVLDDFLSAPATGEARLKRAMPFPGRYYGNGFHHNYFTFGVAYLQGDNPEQAEIYFNRAIALNPEQGAAYYNLGIIYLNQNRLDQAQANLERAVQIDPKDANALNNLGVVYGQRGQYAQAQQYFERTLALAPVHPLALDNLVKLYVYENRPDDARRILEAAVAAAPQEPSLHYDLAMFFVQQNSMAEAKTEFARVVALQPSNAEARNGLAVILMRDGDRSTAERMFLACLQIAPDFDRPYLNLAALYMQQGQTTRARALLSGFLAKHPENTDVNNALHEVEAKP
jgi:Flp pilus assembly protein TadD